MRRRPSVDDTLPFHLLVLILSVDDHTHSSYRCWQRSTLAAAFGVGHGGRLRIDALRTMRFTYVLDGSAEPSSSLRLETSLHADILRLPRAQTCLGKVIAALRHLHRSEAEAYDAVLFSDDDAWLHPHRLAFDFAEFSSASHLVLGTLSWGAGWDETRHAHFGYGNMVPEVAGRLVDVWRRRGSVQGPYPFPLGFVMGLGRGTVTALGEALETQPRLQLLQAREISHDLPLPRQRSRGCHLCPLRHDLLLLALLLPAGAPRHQGLHAQV
jgi:hypothetical protein